MTNLATSYKPAPAVSNSFQIATFTHTLVAAQTGGPDVWLGYIPGTIGTLTPTTLNGAVVLGIFAVLDPPPLAFVVQVNQQVAQSFFTSITIAGDTYTTASAGAFSSDPGLTSWAWSSPANPFSGVGT